VEADPGLAADPRPLVAVSLQSPPQSPRQPPPGRYQPRGAPARPKRGRKWPAVLGVLVLIAAAGVAFTLLHHKPSPGHSPPTNPPTSPPTSHPATSAPPVALGPAATVRAYFAAINAHDYAKAWALGGKNTAPSYSSFASGFNGTAKDRVTVVSVVGDVVRIRLAATQTDGLVRHYRGTYTVANGIITAGHITLLG
jgi:hypothetical protein